MSKVNPADSSVADSSTAFNLNGLTGKNGKYEFYRKWSNFIQYTIINRVSQDQRSNTQWKLFYFHIAAVNLSSTMGGTTTSQTHMITNGICSFSPTSTKGKWIFMIQTIILSFTPIFILLVQNGTAFYSVMQEKELIIHKADLVRYIRGYMMIEHYYAT